MADSMIAKLVTQDCSAAILASLPIVEGPVVVVVPELGPEVPVKLVWGVEGVPLEMTIVTMTPRITTTAKVEIIPTPRSEFRRRALREYSEV